MGAIPDASAVYGLSANWVTLQYDSPACGLLNFGRGKYRDYSPTVKL